MTSPKQLTASSSRRWLWRAAASALGVAALTVVTRATGGQSFKSLDSNYTQALVGTTQMTAFPDGLPMGLGGLAFAPGGDVWAADCVFQGTRLHRFALSAPALPSVHGTATLHAEIAVVSTQGGCGLVNWADPHAGKASLFSNSAQGVYELDASTAAVIRGPLGPAGNSLGIAVDPLNNHVVYAGADCHDTLVNPTPMTCTLWDLDPSVTDGHPTRWAQTTHDRLPFIDGIYFDPTGSRLFVANRLEDDGRNALSVLARPTTPLVGDSQIVQDVDMTAEPDGVAFHDSSDPFVVTNDEFDPVNGVGTMTRFDFSNGFDQPPVKSLVKNANLWYANETRFADGGFRGDLAQVGPDGCLYVTQGRFYADDGLGNSGNGTRYDDGFETTEDSIVKICGLSGGFVPATGVTDTVNGGPAKVGTVGGTVYRDTNGNGVRDSGEPPLSNVTVTLSGEGSGSTVSQADGTYAFSGLSAGTYTVSAPGSTVSLALSTASPLTTTLSAGATVANLDFGYKPGSVAGIVYRDSNGNAMRDAGEPPLANVTVTLSGDASSTAVSQADGSYIFMNLLAGTYSVSAPGAAANLARSTASPLGVALAAGVSQSGLDFGYKPGQLGGTVFRDTNGNGMRDAGEPTLSGVTVTLGGYSTAVTTSQTDGTYSFRQLDGGSYIISVPAAAAGLTLSTTSPLTTTLGAGATVGGLDFGYKPGALSGYAYVDSNRNGTMDTGEAPLGGVTIAAGPSGTTVTKADGSYGFSDLVAGPYTLSAPASATGASGNAPLGGQGAATSYALITPNPLNPTLPAGGSMTNLNFGYAPPCFVSIQSTKFSGKELQFTIMNSGSANAVLSALTLTWPTANGKLVQVKLDGDIVYDKPDIAPPSANLTSAQLVTDVNKLSIQARTSDVLHLVFEKNASTVIGGYSGTFTFGSCNVSISAPSSACSLGYPFTSSNPRTSVVFNENEVLQGFDPYVAQAGDTLRVFASDEHALLLGVRTASSAVSPLSSNPGHVASPVVGDKTAKDPSGRPIFPALFVTDITGISDDATHKSAAYRAGDWQFNGVGIAPDDIFGTWKGATISAGSILTDADPPTKNHWSLGTGSDVPSAGFSSLSDIGYGTEVRWNVDNLRVGGQPLQTGHSYRVQFMVHDGDQNKMGGDVGQACAIVTIK